MGSDFMEGAGAVEREGEVRAESEGKLSMMCWNVCGWFKDGRGMEQMRKAMI